MQAAGHSQMHEQLAIVLEIENNEFSAAPDGCYCPAPDPVTKRFCRRFRDRTGPENPCGLYGLTHEAGCVEVVDDGLYFRKFGHVQSRFRGLGFQGSGFRVQTFKGFLW